MTTTQTQSTTTVSPAPKAKPIECGRYSGAFQAFQRAFYHTLVAFGISHKVAHKVGDDFGSDLGRAMSKDADVAAVVAKANKNHEASIKLSGKSARVACSNAMSLNRLCVLAEAAFNEKLVAKRQLPEPIPALREYLEECEVWAEDKEFVE